MGRKVFISYAHRLDQEAMEAFASIFSDERDVFVDKSLREDLEDRAAATIKARLYDLIRDSTVTIVLIGKDTGGRAWVDWEIYNSLRKGPGRERNGLLGVRIPYKEHWVPERLEANVPTMGLVVDWPRDYRTLANYIEEAYNKRWNAPDLSAPLRQRNSSRRS